MFLRGNNRLEFLFALQNYDKYPNQEKISDEENEYAINRHSSSLTLLSLNRIFLLFESALALFSFSSYFVLFISFFTYNLSFGSENALQNCNLLKFLK